MGEGGDWGDELDPVKWDERKLQEFKSAFLEMPEQEDESEARVNRDKLAIKVHERECLRSVPVPTSSFKDLGVVPEYAVKGLKEHRINNPWPLQAQVWPLLLRGCDLCASAPPGAGKTLGYLVPAIVHIEAQKERVDKATPIALVIVPSHEHAQITDYDAKIVLRHSKEGLHKDSAGVWCTCVSDSVSRQDQVRALQWNGGGAQIVVATPKRLVDFVKSKVISLERVTFFVVDNADHIIEDNLQGAVMAISKQVRPDRQCIVFANDWTKEVGELAKKLCTRKNAPFARISVGDREDSSGDRIAHFLAEFKDREGMVHEVVATSIPDREDRDQQERRSNEKEQRLIDHLKQILKDQNDNRALVFVSERDYANHLSARLRASSVEACAFHGGKVQESRLWMVDKFRRGDLRVMVATDVVGRGIEVPTVSHIVLFEVSTVEEYVTKVCRPAPHRDGKGHVLVFFDHDPNDEQDGEADILAPDLVKLLEGLRQKVPEELRRVADESAARRRTALAEGRNGAAGVAGRSHSSTHSSPGRQGAPAMLVEREPSRPRGASRDSETSSRTCFSPDRRRNNGAARPTSGRRKVAQRRRYPGRSRGASARRDPRRDRGKPSGGARRERRRRSGKQQQPAAPADRNSAADDARTRTRTPPLRGNDARSADAASQPQAVLGAAPKSSGVAVSGPVPGAGAKARPALPTPQKLANAADDSLGSNAANPDGDTSSSEGASDKPRTPRRSGAPGRPGPTNALTPKTGGEEGLPIAGGASMPTPLGVGTEEAARKPKPLPQPQAKKLSLPPPKEKEKSRLPGQADKATGREVSHANASDAPRRTLPQPLQAAAQQARNAARAERGLGEGSRSEGHDTPSKRHHHGEVGTPKKKSVKGAAGAAAGSLPVSSPPSPSPPLYQSPVHHSADLLRDVWAEAEERAARLGESSAALPAGTSQSEAELERARADLERKQAELIERETHLARRETEIRNQIRKHEEQRHVAGGNHQPRSATAQERAQLDADRQRHAHQAAMERAELEKQKARLEVQAERGKAELDAAKRQHDEKMEEAYAELEKMRAAFQAQQAAALERAQASQEQDQLEAQKNLEERQKKLDDSSAELAGREAALSKRKTELERKETAMRKAAHKLEAMFTQENERQAVHREDMEALRLRHVDAVAKDKELLAKDRDALEQAQQNARIEAERSQVELQRATEEKAKCEAHMVEMRKTIIQKCEEAEKKMIDDRREMMSRIEEERRQLEESENKIAIDRREVERMRVETISAGTEQQRELTAKQDQVERMQSAIRIEAENTRIHQEELQRRREDLEKREATLNHQAEMLVRQLEDAKVAGAAKGQQEADQALKILQEQASEERQRAADKREEAERQAAAARAEAESCKREREQLSQEREDARREAKEIKKEKKLVAQEREKLETFEEEIKEREQDLKQHERELDARAEAVKSVAGKQEALQKWEEKVASMASEVTEAEAKVAEAEAKATQFEKMLNERAEQLNQLLQHVVQREQAVLQREQASGTTGPVVDRGATVFEETDKIAKPPDNPHEKPEKLKKVDPAEGIGRVSDRGVVASSRTRDNQRGRGRKRDGSTSSSSRGRRHRRGRSPSSSKESRSGGKPARNKKSKRK